MEKQPEFWAFISYSHADEKWARWLHRALETYRLPRRLVGQRTSQGTVPQRLFPVFRDRDELATAESLGERITAALERSRTLLVLASPASAGSRWVNEEVRAWKRLGRGDRIICLIVDGDPGDAERECFAPALKSALGPDGELSGEPVEPLAADLRPGGDGRRTALLKTVAGILGLELDALRQRDQQRRQRRLLGALAASLALSAITTALAIAALQARDLAQVRRAQAEQLIQFMMVDLRTRLETIGKLEVLDAVGDQASAYFGQVDTGELTVAERKLHATSLRQLGELQRMRGRHDEAEALLGEALALAEANARLDPLDLAAMDEIAAAQFELGTIAFYTGRVEASLEWCGRAAETARALIARDPDDPRWHRRLASARYLAAQSHLRAGGFAAALASATAAETAYRLAVSLGDPTVESARGLALTLTSLAVTHRLRGEPGDSLAFATRATDESRAVLALANSDYGDRYNLSRALSTLALARLRQGQVDAAVASAFESLREAETLQASDPSNGGWRQHHVSALNMMATTRMAAGDYALAAEHASRGIEELRRVANGVEDSDARQWTLAALLFKLSEAQLQLGDREAAVRAAEKGIAIWPDGHGGNSYVAHYLGALLIAALEAAPDREPDARHALLSSALDVLGDSNTAETEGLRLRAALLRGRIEDASGTHVRLRALGAPDFSVDRFLRRYCAAPPTAAAAFCDEISAASGS